MSTDDRVTARLAELTAQRAAIPDDGALPVTTTNDEMTTIRAERQRLDHRIATIHAAVARCAALGDQAQDESWRDQLVTWRHMLMDRLLALKPIIRNTDIRQGIARNLALSVDCIDFGPRAFKDSGWELENSQLGALMREAGYEPVGADLSRNYVGALPWFGALSDVEQRIADLATQRATAHAALDEALLDDDARAQRDAESAALRDAFNSMRVRHSSDGKTLVAFTTDGAVLEISEMTPLQRSAFERAQQQYSASS